MTFSDKKIENRPFNVPMYDRIHRSLVLKLAWKSLQALKFSNSPTFPEFWIKCWNSPVFLWFFSQISNSLTFPGFLGFPGCVATLLYQEFWKKTDHSVTCWSIYVRTILNIRFHETLWISSWTTLAKILVTQTFPRNSQIA